jgi:hypothetical protein
MKNYKLVLLFLLFLFGFSELKAQVYYDDVVYLKNENVYKGVILENIINDKLKIQITGGSIIVIKYDEIDKIERVLSASPIRPKTNGLFYHINMSFMFGSRFDNRISSGFSLRNTIGYRFMDNFAVGGGFGLDAVGQETFFPSYLDLRYYLNTKELSPYIYGNGGYAFPAGGVNSSQFGGSTISGGFGIIKYLKDKSAFTFNLGYLYMESEKQFQSNIGWNNPSFTVKRKDIYNRVEVRFGYVFL